MILTVLKKTTTALKRRLSPERTLYVVTTGTYKGDWLVRVKPGSTESVYMVLPDKEARVISNKDFEWGLANKVIEVVDVLPKAVYNVCLANFGQTKTNAQRSNTASRRQQHSPQDSLDSQQYRETVS